MPTPDRLIQVLCLALASSLGMLVAGCSGSLGAPSLTAPAAPSPTASSSHKSHTTTALDLLFGSQFESLTPRDATVRCSAKDSTVVVRGSVVGDDVTIRLSGLREGQHLNVPPTLGGYTDRVTVTVAGAKPTESLTLTYLVGFTKGTYQGVGTIDVGKSGTRGTLRVSAPSPVGQPPSIQGSGIYVTIGANSMSLDGTWKCP
jgi:hypothetical protein